MFYSNFLLRIANNYLNENENEEPYKKFKES